MHPWLAIDNTDASRDPIPSRTVLGTKIRKCTGDYGDFAGLVEVTRALYRGRIKSEITMGRMSVP